LLAGKLIVNIVVYADESGTHDPSSKETGSKMATLAGYAGFADDWAAFCDDWQAALNDDDIKVFHFSDFADKKNRSKDPSWPYFKWNEKRRDDFLMRLARLAGNRIRFPFGSTVNVVQLNNSDALRKIEDHLVSKGVALEFLDKKQIAEFSRNIGLFWTFFEVILNDIKLRWPHFDGSVSFVFDRKLNDPVWQFAADLTFGVIAGSNEKLIAPTFGNKTCFLPLQAADMFAYRYHQIRENEIKHKGQKPHVWSELDHHLFGERDQTEFAAYRASLISAAQNIPKNVG
jgi:hypothetical protein